MKKIVEGLKELLTMDDMEADKICEKMKEIENEATCALYASNSSLFDKDVSYKFIHDLMLALRKSVFTYYPGFIHLNPELELFDNLTKRNPFDALHGRVQNDYPIRIDFFNEVKEAIGGCLKIITKFELDKEENGYSYIYIDNMEQKEIEYLSKLFGKIKVNLTRIGGEINQQTLACPFDIKELTRTMINLVNGQSKDFWRNMIYGYVCIF